MLKKALFILMLGAFVCMPLASAWAELLHYPNETAFYDPARAYNGVHLFTPQNSLATYMIDLDGRLIHKWNRPSTDTSTVWYATFEENGTLSRAISVPNNATIDPNTNMTGGGVAGALEEVGWGGGVLRSWNVFRAAGAAGAAFRSHHRYDRMYNKTLKAWTYLFLVWETRTQAEGTGLGGTAVVPAKGWSSDGIVELDYAGNVVWRWSLFDHTCQSTTPGLPNSVADVFTAPNKWDVNALSTTRSGPVNDWIHLNSLGYDPAKGHIVMNSREMNELFVIDHDGTFTSATDFAANIAAAAGAGGDFKYRFGSPSNYHAPDFNVGTPSYTARPLFANYQSTGGNGAVQIWGAHSVHFIKPTFYTNGPALSGKGNILIMDNGGCNGNPMGTYSTLKELNPFVTGAPAGTPPVFPTQAAYKLQHDGVGYHQVASTPGIGYGQINQSNQIVWKFAPNNDIGFSSSHISGVQRLPNGNTIGTSGEAGSIFEVTAGSNAGANPEAWAGTSPELVWNYTNPMIMTTVNGVRKMVPTTFSTNPTFTSIWQIFTSFRYGADYPGLKNRLVQYPDGTILPVDFTSQPGIGHTLTGQVPCRSIPCKYVGTP